MYNAFPFWMMNTNGYSYPILSVQIDNFTINRHFQKYVLEFFLVKSNSRTKAFVYFPW